MARMVDGFKAGTNYCHRMAAGSSRDQSGALIALRATQDVRCARGEHDPAQARKGYVTYIGSGQRVDPGTWYCRGCKKILPDP
jgi:hypothetical protein